MKNQCLIRIKSAYPHLSDKEKMIADYILQYPEETIHSSINQVSAKLDVADATVFRFCRRLEFKGFQEMKIVLASDIAQRRRREQLGSKYENDEVMHLADSVFQNNIRTLENTLQIIDSHSFKRAVKVLSESEKIVFFASGGSSLIAQDAHRKFVRTGILTYAPGDGEFQMLSVAQLTSRDTAVFISYSASDKQLLQVAKAAKTRGCKLIGINGFMKSQLGELMDIPLHTVSVATDFRTEASVARAVQLTLIDALFVNVMTSLEKKKMKQTGNAVDALV